MARTQKILTGKINNENSTQKCGLFDPDLDEEIKDYTQSAVQRFRFKDHSDQELQDYIQEAKDQIVKSLNSREFDSFILTMGITLIELEYERSQRQSKH
ncbi:hypothetical protein [Cytobacillus sp. FSL H8-0458]|uniref:hypothetical protein n=1 Tax=Cytobacillus sp. FSL H8-0458 TaxID=2975346 RepID=UPI0030FBC09A